MPRVEVIKNFATAQECAELNDWVMQGVENKWLDVGFDGGKFGYKKRVTSRMYTGRGSNPSVAFQVQEKICQHWGLQSFSTATTAGGNDGIVVSCTFGGGDVCPHIDPRCGTPMSTLRCNLLTSAAEVGCDLYIEGQKIDFAEGDLVCYLVTEWPHYVTENLGDKPRNLWMFGWYVPSIAWELEEIKGVRH